MDGKWGALDSFSWLSLTATYRCLDQCFCFLPPITDVDIITLWTFLWSTPSPMSIPSRSDAWKMGSQSESYMAWLLKNGENYIFLVSSWYQCRRGEVCGGNDSARECFRWCNWFLHCWVDPERIVAFYLSFGFERRSQMRILCSWIDDLKSCDASNIDGLKSGSVNVDPWLFRTYLFREGCFECAFSLSFSKMLIRWGVTELWSFNTRC